MRRYWILPLIALIGASAARAAEVSALSDMPESVVAGQAILLSWDAPPGDADEAELELSLDGRHWMRISPQFDASERSWSWRVPDVAAKRARLRLRAGDEEREVVVAVSRDFRIEGACAPAGSPRGHEAEWWRRLAPDDRDGPASVRADLPALTRTVDHAQAECHASPALRVPGSRTRIPLEPRSPVTVPGERPTGDTTPVFFPLRN